MSRKRRRGPLELGVSQLGAVFHPAGPFDAVIRQEMGSSATPRVATDSPPPLTSVPDSAPSDQGSVRAPSPGAMSTTEQPLASAPAPVADPPEFVLPAAFDATRVRELHGALKERLAQTSGPVIVDGTQVETVDTAGAQLLAALGLSGRRVSLKASKVLADFLKVTAFEAVLSPEQ